jgi:hypothetical protein
VEYLHGQEVIGFSWFRIGVSILRQKKSSRSIIAFKWHTVSGEVEEQTVFFRSAKLAGESIKSH